MTTHRAAVLVPFLAAALAAPSTLAEQAAPSQPPMAAKRPRTTRIHGHTLEDDYFWLREKCFVQVSLNDSQVPYREWREVRRKAARDEDRQEPAPAQDEHGRGARRLLWPVRRAA